MAITINDKVFRNLQEQVGYLTDEYKALIKQLPYNGPYESTDDIPDDELVDNGTYLIEDDDAYKIYKYDESTEDFIDLGYFGAKGDRGDKGDKGDTGATGATGAKGATGAAAGFGTPVINVTTVTAVEEASGTVTASGDDTAKVFTFDFNIPRGLDGTPGPQGEKGDKGDQGIMGPTGPKGDKGNTGNTGAAAGFGTPRTHVTTLASDADATASIETTGPDTAKVFTFNFGIPQGIQGIQGIQGEQGIQGIQGETGEAAGFDTPTATAVKLIAGSNPTASVTASGPDTAKVFAFTFGIPKGDKGDTGDPNSIVIGANTYTGTTITLPTTTLQFTSFNGTTTTSYIVLG